MRRAIRFLLLSLALLFQPAPWTGQSRTMQGQQEHHVYLPLVSRSDNVSDWKIIVPEGTTNLVENPSFEVNVTDSWNLTNGARARSTTRARFGIASAQQTAAGVGLASYLATADLISVADGETIYAQAYLYRATAIDAFLAIRDITTPATRATATPASTGEWELLQCQWTNTTGGAVDVRIWFV